MKWKSTPIVKLYEALGAVADGRVEIDGDVAKVYSSSRNKFYDITYDADENAIMANDNGSYWNGYLGYPGIAYLLKTGVFEYKPEFGEMLKGIAWKDINQKHKNNFDKALEEILEPLSGEERNALDAYVSELDKEMRKADLNLLGKKKFPPKGY